MTGPVLVRGQKDVERLPTSAFLDAVRSQVERGARPVSLYGRPGEGRDAVVLTCVLAGPSPSAPAELQVLRTSVDRRRGYPSLTKELPRFHAFERELHEQHGVTPGEHPWLKPIRFAGRAATPMDAYPFFDVEGKEVHEVAVGPIHAGVIEPGSFRFMCHGERVLHLEVHLGYQHRGVEALLLRRPAKLLAPLMESVAGDSSVAYVTAYCRAIEALAGHRLGSEHEWVRGVALELERIAMHLAGLAGMATDVAFLPGASTYGRLRTAIINASQRICGNRFGRGWIRPGGARAGLDRAMVAAVRELLAEVRRDKAGIDALMSSSSSVAHRLRTTGVLTKEVAERIGLVGMAARACGVAVDQRVQLPDPSFERAPIPITLEPDGDCWARCRLRAREVEASLDWLEAAFGAAGGEVPGVVEPLGQLAPDSLGVSIVEGWRGEVVVVLETDAEGGLRHARVQDPSLQNWLGVAMAVRDNAISDFPICNKSFDLSYCGNDL